MKNMNQLIRVYGLKCRHRLYELTDDMMQLFGYM
ncbi:hypothetical protein DFO83_1243 [Idiomarina loihiensis]|nr:hypothetical protein DFO83_1243 [Idiomarina loihiensis]TDP43561.1 hypothetical protein DET58_1221 [Idiomarina loihiensis]TDS18439.1 hypothetical protein DET62_1223 [Idiomarina sp. H2]